MEVNKKKTNKMENARSKSISKTWGEGRAITIYSNSNERGSSLKFKVHVLVYIHTCCKFPKIIAFRCKNVPKHGEPQQELFLAASKRPMTCRKVYIQNIKDIIRAQGISIHYTF